MYYAEHRFLGDTTDITEKGSVLAPNTLDAATPFKLDNGLLVTYGEINGFAGDYFGYDKPISSEANIDKMKDIFQRWFDLLGYSPGGKSKAEALRAELKIVNDQADKILRSPQGTANELAMVYQKTPLDIWHLDAVSKDMRWANGASFMQLLESNVDHFGPEARLTYNAGHALALDWAAKGDLNKALAINAFADHFLQDSFAAGHMRVPRAEVMEVSKHDTSAIPKYSQIVNACSNVMHEEDGEVGLWVDSPSGEKWKAYGDSRLPGTDTTGKATSTSLDQCRKALRQSVKEVHDAHSSKQPIPPSQFAAWRHAPINANISANPDNHKPLIKVEGGKILARTGGLTSSTYQPVSGLAWLGFYQENFSRVENQVALMIEKTLGIKLK